jgi:hypothetical protein
MRTTWAEYVVQQQLKGIFPSSCVPWSRIRSCLWYSAYTMASSTSRSLPTEPRAPQEANKSSTPVPADVEPATPGMLSGEAEDTTNQRKYKYSVTRRLLAFIFAWMIHASFIVLPGSLDSLEQSNVPSNVVGVVLRSGQNIPLYVLSLFSCPSLQPPPPPGPRASVSSFSFLPPFDW